MTDVEYPGTHSAAAQTDGTGESPKLLILTPVKDAAEFAFDYFERLKSLTYPHDRISVGILESDSKDATYAAFMAAAFKNQSNFRSVQVWRRHFQYRIPDGMPKWEPSIQFKRRTVLALSRNHLLFHALDDEDWVLWLDVDVIEFPSDIIERLLAYGKDILHPHCVKIRGGRTFDLNAWRDHGQLTMDSLRGEDELVELDAVGGTMLLVRADCHRDGLIFPPFLYGRRNPLIRERTDIGMPEQEGEVETEGLGVMAADMHIKCWGVPNLEIIHAPY